MPLAIVPVEREGRGDFIEILTWLLGGGDMVAIRLLVALSRIAVPPLYNLMGEAEEKRKGTGVLPYMYKYMVYVEGRDNPPHTATYNYLHSSVCV